MKIAIAFILAMRYKLFFTSSLFPLPYSLFPAPYSLLHIRCSLLPTPCSLLPAPCSLKTINLYLTSRRIAILGVLDLFGFD